MTQRKRMENDTANLIKLKFKTLTHQISELNTHTHIYVYVLYVSWN